MSDGQSDARAVAQLHVQLEEAAYQLRDAIKTALEGHRGMAIPVLAVVNEVLDECGFFISARRGT